jgi:Ca-activated chloride channel family protein
VSLLVAFPPASVDRRWSPSAWEEPPEKQLTVTGRVTDAATKQPVTQATVQVREATTVGAITDSAGRYRIVIPSAVADGRELTLLVRRIGYSPAILPLRGYTDTLTVDVALTASVTLLENLVVTGTSVTTVKRALGSAIYGSQAGNGPAVIRARGAASLNGTGPGIRRAGEPANTEGYDAIAENPFIAASVSPRSTFSIDVDHASYSNVRRFIRGGELPPRDAVRIEELVNYFPYELPAPVGDDPVSITTEVAAAPWNPEHRLVRVGLRGRPVDVADLPPNNLVFLIDVSGSMEDENKLPLLKSAFRLLVNELRPQDRVALVVYAGSAGLVLPPTPGDQKDRILQAIDTLEAGGSTAGGAGIRLAYDIAKATFMPDGNNRVILATDGDFNVGVSSDAEMVELIEERREQGTFLTVLGFGMGNVKDSKMEKLADKGNGNYAYVDNLMEARKVLVTEMGGTLLTVAKDVKLQIEFNPTRVSAYRLIGYENRLLRDEDFKDDRKDAGDLGAGHSVTALYEIIPPGARNTSLGRRPDALRYARPAPLTSAASTSELLFVKLRYKPPSGRQSRELTHVVTDVVTSTPSTDFTFAAAVAELGMVLRDSPHKGASSIDSVIARAKRGGGPDAYGYRGEFVHLAEMAKQLMAGERVATRDRKNDDRR